MHTLKDSTSKKAASPVVLDADLLLSSGLTHAYQTSQDRISRIYIIIFNEMEKKHSVRSFDTDSFSCELNSLPQRSDSFISRQAV